MYKIRELTPTLLFLLLLPPTATACSAFITQDCSFHFSGPSCPFLKCSDPNGTVRSYIWDTCITMCCQAYNGPDDPPIIETLDSYCLGVTQTKEKLPLGATIAVALGLVIFIILTIGMCFYLKLAGCLCPCLMTRRREEGYREDVRPAPSQLEIVQVEKRREEVFVTEEFFEERENQRLCSICLDAETNVSTKCGHFFHSECLFEWLKRRQSCPECRMQGLDGFVLYCSKCQKNYQKINILTEKQGYECKYCKL